MPRIVLIEDNVQSARLAAKVLTRHGHVVEVCPTGEEGLNKILATPPDLVLVDLGLPDIDGQTIVAVIRQQPNLAQTPVIAFTAWPPEKARSMALAYGCDGVITKPFDTREFPKQIQAFLTKAPAPDSPPVSPEVLPGK